MEKDRIESFNQQQGIADQRKRDEATIEQYLKANNIQTQRTPWGAYVQILSPGSGPKPKYGQFAMLRYTGKDLEGNVFDATEKHGGQLLPLQIGAGRSIPGFEDGVKQLSKGAKAVIYVPSVAGYGERGTPADPQSREQAIKPNQNLVFEVEVVDIADQPTQAPTAQMTDSTRR
jgi:FKBP-type peptidyl-prolyl cis-trans isomerase